MPNAKSYDYDYIYARLMANDIGVTFVKFRNHLSYVKYFIVNYKC